MDTIMKDIQTIRELLFGDTKDRVSTEQGIKMLEEVFERFEKIENPSQMMMVMGALTQIAQDIEKDMKERFKGTGIDIDKVIKAMMLGGEMETKATNDVVTNAKRIDEILYELDIDLRLYEYKDATVLKFDKIIEQEHLHKIIQLLRDEEYELKLSGISIVMHKSELHMRFEHPTTRFKTLVIDYKEANVSKEDVRKLFMSVTDFVEKSREKVVDKAHRNIFDLLNKIAK